ncbi:IS21 family transposase [Bacillus piscicola]|uniref:IS21 family transposase n=1 Tax=Bacillus piscicola TaxID=1632684 RepID=UPI001F08B4C4
MGKWMVYQEVHRLKNMGFSNSKIAKKLKISRNRVIDYLGMTPDEFAVFIASLQNRTKKLDPYQRYIVTWLKEHPDMTSAQIYDWLQERLDVQSVAENTVRNYVNELRDRYHLPKVTVERIYGTVEELPMGRQMQVDFGEILIYTNSGQRKKLYVAGFILSHSRFKYVEWLDRPFRTADLIRMQENAFRYFGGMTEEIVYDQDRLLAVSENAGDLILTESFTKYHETRRFKIYLCRKSDPESKGKIEQVIKYVKHNFAKHRIFESLESWQHSCLKWLKRTGNYKIHHNIKKRPFEVHALEKQHLQKVNGNYIFEKISTINITRKIHKDNVIRFEGNRYSVPLGTFQKGAENIAYISITGEKLSISLHPTSSPIAVHHLSKEKGNIITEPTHRQRSQTKRDKLAEQVMEHLAVMEDSTWLIKVLQEHYPRHVIDQLKIVLKIAEQHPGYINDAVKEMKRLGLTSANDLRDIAVSLEIQSNKNAGKTEVMNEKYKDIAAPERNQDVYLQVLQGDR